MTAMKAAVHAKRKASRIGATKSDMFIEIGPIPEKIAVGSVITWATTLEVSLSFVWAVASIFQATGCGEQDLEAHA